MMRFVNVSYAYRTSQGVVRALEHVSFDLRPGESLAVLGANGSGKSTLARLANGLYVPDEGSVRIEEYDTSDPEHAWDVRRRVGLVFQNPDNQIVGTVVEEDVAFGPENLGVPRPELRARVDAALAVVGLTGLERREPHLLSGGQKQRLAIAGALAMEPAYLVFDEPTSMLDPEGRHDVLDVIDRLRAQGHAILHVTHDLAQVARADRVLVLISGTLAFTGRPADLFASPERLEGWGLELPPLVRLTSRLRSLGRAVPTDAVDPESVVSALCPSS